MDDLFELMNEEKNSGFFFKAVISSKQLAFILHETSIPPHPSSQKGYLSIGEVKSAQNWTNCAE